MIEAAYRVVGAGLERIPGLLREAGAPAPCDVLVIAASAGEVKAARCLREAAEGNWLIATGTPAGMVSGADIRGPRDTPRAVGRFLDAASPRLLILVEAELWPTLLFEADRRGLPTVVVSARMTEPAMRGWTRVPRRAAERVFGRVSLWLTASEGDARRLARMVPDVDRIRHGGLLKWPSPPDPEQVRIRRHEAHGSGPLVVLGSVHPGEPEALARRLAGTSWAPDRSRWRVVPRHPGPSASRRFSAFGEVETRFGLLASWYGAADLAYVGGGLTGRGLHDPLEAIAGGLAPLLHRRRGDPADLGQRLRTRGLVTDLDRDPVPESASRIPEAYESLRRDWDGRSTTLAAIEALLDFSP